MEYKDVFIVSMIETKYTVANFETNFHYEKTKMPKKLYNLDLTEFISSLELNSFTISDVTRRLLEKYSEEFDKKKNATQFVYRHLKRLQQEGVLSALPGESGKPIIFLWSEGSKKDNKESDAYISQELNAVDDVVVGKLKDKIRRYKMEMLTSMGETEAYSEWVQEMPEFTECVKPYYQYTREQAKLMLGKVKGFERLLAEYEARH